MNYNYEPVCHPCSSQNVAQQQSLINHHSNICVTASYFSQVDARPRHFLIETQDETGADDEGASLNQNGFKPEVASLNRQSDPSDDLYFQWECRECLRVNQDDKSKCPDVCDKV